MYNVPEILEQRIPVDPYQADDTEGQQSYDHHNDPRGILRRE